MTTEQTIQDVAMIARNGIDRVIELERDKARLQAEVTRLRELSDEMIVGGHKAPFTCYCHEIDHGTSEDRALFGSGTSEP